MKKGMVSAFALTLFIINLVSAGVYFSQPSSTYNLGDIIKMNVDLNPVENGPLAIKLVCDSKSGLVFYNSNPASSSEFELPLTSMHIADLTGSCYFSGDYMDKEYKSIEFKISKKLNVVLTVDSIFVNPGDEIVIEGSAKRQNGAGINGELEISIPLLKLLKVAEEDEEANETEETGANESEEVVEEIPEIIDSDDSTFYGKIVDGEFSIKFNLAPDMGAGDYRVDVLAYEEMGGNRTSEGIAMANLKVFQVLTGADIALNNQNLNPGDIASFRPMLVDQAGEPIYERVSVFIKNENLERIFEKIVDSEQTVDYTLPTNLTAGYYEVEVLVDDISGVKKFYVNEKEMVSFSLENETLIVTNIGNVPYRKSIEVELNGKPFVKKLDLELGGVQEFRLTGSDGNYDVRISDGETEISKSGVALTGGVIGVKDIKEKGSLALSTPIVWIFLIIILGAGILFLFRNIFKKKSFASPLERFKRKPPVVDMVKSEKKEKHEKKEIKTPGALHASGEAEQVLVLKGHKSRAVVIALKIKNKIGKLEKQSLEKSIEHVYDKRGAVYEQGDYVFIIFSPLMTRISKNEAEAAKAAEKISLVLKEHNKKFKDKIEFGIGINSGDIINKIENKKLKFTALGNFIAAAKRLAESSDEQILVSKEAYQGGISNIKAEKKKIAGGEVYEIRRVIDYEKNQKFIQGFLERMKREEKK